MFVSSSLVCMPASCLRTLSLSTVNQICLHGVSKRKRRTMHPATQPLPTSEASSVRSFGTRRPASLRFS